jgi:cobalt-zinc-cadmium efflux system outer membrane protein
LQRILGNISQDSMKLFLNFAVMAMLWITVSTGLAQAPPAPAGGAITLEQALQIARTRNPLLASGQAHVAATRAAEQTARLRVNPNFTLSGSQINLPANNPSNPYGYVGNFSRLFERGDKRRWRMETAQATTALTQSQFADTERQTVFNVKTSFTQMLAAKAALLVTEENLKSYRQTIDLDAARLAAGDISVTDHERVDLQMAQFESDNETAKLNLLQASASLQQLLGADRLDAKFDVVGTLDPPVVQETVESLEQKGIASRPDYIAALKQIAVSDSQIHLADSMRLADPTIGAEYERIGTYNGAGFQLGIPLRLFDRNQGERERTRYEAQSSRFAATAAKNQVIADVDQAWAGYESAVRIAQRYTGHYLGEADRVRGNIEFSYRHQGTTLLDYLSALQDYRQIHLDSLNANAQVWLAVHRLSEAAATEVVP